MQPKFTPVLEEALGQLFENEIKEDPRQLKLFADPKEEDKKPDSTARKLLKEMEKLGGMSRTDMMKFAFENRRKSTSSKGDNFKFPGNWWGTNISAMSQAKIIVKDGKNWIVNPSVDIDKLKIVMPKWQTSWNNSDKDIKERAKWRANIKGAKKQTSEAVADNMPEENTDELKKSIGKVLESLKKVTPILKNFADFTERRGFNTGEVVSEIRKYGSDPIAKKLLEKAIIAINEEA